MSTTYLDPGQIADGQHVTIHYFGGSTHTGIVKADGLRGFVVDSSSDDPSDVPVRLLLTPDKTKFRHDIDHVTLKTDGPTGPAIAALEQQFDNVGGQHDQLKQRIADLEGSINALVVDLSSENLVTDEGATNILKNAGLPTPVDVEYTITFRAEVRPASSDVVARLKGKHTARAMLENALTGLATINLDETVFPDIGRAEATITSVDVID